MESIELPPASGTSESSAQKIKMILTALTQSLEGEPLSKTRPRKKQKMGDSRDDVPKGSKKPPSSGAPGIAGLMSKASSLDFERTALPGRH
jgi:hypothetical protein